MGRSFVQHGHLKKDGQLTIAALYCYNGASYAPLTASDRLSGCFLNWE